MPIRDSNYVNPPWSLSVEKNECGVALTARIECLTPVPWPQGEALLRFCGTTGQLPPSHSEFDSVEKYSQ